MRITSKIKGGLGNQMFQYACGRAITHRLGAQLCLDISWFKKGNREYALDNFPHIQSIKKSHSTGMPSLFQKIFRRLKIHYFHEPDYSYWPGIEKIKTSAHITGYWQNENYFSAISPIIKQDFQFPEFTCPEAEEIAGKIKEAPCPVSIHIRRGDYVENDNVNKIFGTCSLEYYQKALHMIIEKNNMPVQLFLFSDDPEWIKNNFDTQGCTSAIIDIPQHKNTPHHDMHLMSLCSHHIIANSSFSWWGAWLSNRQGTVIAPEQWFAKETRKHHNPAAKLWIKI